jgi:hypothetical protein
VQNLKRRSGAAVNGRMEGTINKETVLESVFG